LDLMENLAILVLMDFLEMSDSLADLVFLESRENEDWMEARDWMDEMVNLATQENLETTVFLVFQEHLESPFLANLDLLVFLAPMDFLECPDLREKLEVLVILDPLEVLVLLVTMDFLDSLANLD